MLSWRPDTSRAYYLAGFFVVRHANHTCVLRCVIHTTADEGSGCTATKTTMHGAEGTEHGAERTEPLSFDAAGNPQERRVGPREFDQDIYGIMTATQDSFRRQLADMRDNLNKVIIISCDRLDDRRTTRRVRSHSVDKTKAGLDDVSKDECGAMYCSWMWALSFILGFDCYRNNEILDSQTA